MEFNDFLDICWLFQSFNWLFDLLIDFYDPLIDFFDLYIDLLIKISWNSIENDQNLIEIVIVDTIWSSKSESDQNRRSNLAGLESKSSTIRCQTPNCISLSHIKSTFALKFYSINSYCTCLDVHCNISNVIKAKSILFGLKFFDNRCCQVKSDRALWIWKASNLEKLRQIFLNVGE